MKGKIDYTVASEIAQKVVAKLAPHCERIEEAGSLRRMKGLIGDVELMIVPTPALYTFLDSLLASGKIRHREPKCWGEKMRSFIMTTVGSHALDIQFDLFIQPDPATFGVNMLLRTGCAEFSHRMVTKRCEGGWCPDCYVVKNARVWDTATGEALDTLEEDDVFRLWGMVPPSPMSRTEDYQPIWEDVEFERPAPKKLEFGEPVQNMNVAGTMGGLTMERAEQIIAQSRLWPNPVTGSREAAQQSAHEAILKITGRIL